MFDDIFLLIPALDPDERLLRLAAELKGCGFDNILIVNDGSDKSCREYFEKARSEYGCIIFEHYRNYGKGRALKNGFNHILSGYPGIKGIITVDSDGQHRTEDVVKCAEILNRNADKNVIVLGCRDFSEKNIPPRSKFGNNLTKRVLRYLCGINVSDTQTGLRGFTRRSADLYLDTAGERYEYEMNMIIESESNNTDIIEYKIETIYIDNNASSHFNPLKDSLRIYRQFFKYMIASLSSFVIDISLFHVFAGVLSVVFPVYYIFISTYGARFVSSVFNFLINHNKVFNSKAPLTSSAVRYICLAVVQAGVSAAVVSLISKGFGFNETIVKIFTDTVLFIFSYKIQQIFVFKNKKTD